MKARTFDVLSVATLAAAAVASALVWDRLPANMPTHFDLSGTPNGWMPRAWGASFAPVFGLAIWAVVRFVGRLAPSPDKKPAPAPVMALVAFLTTALLAAIHLLILRASLSPATSVMRPMWMLLGAFMFVMGLVMPRLRQNAVAGIRTAWTLGNAEVWARTHRVAGYAMTAAGLVAFVAGLVGGTAAGAIAITMLLVASLGPAVYSYLVSRSLARR